MQDYTSRIQALQTFVTKQKLNREILNERSAALLIEKTQNTEWVTSASGAREVINVLVQKTLDQISGNIGQLVTEAIHAVFENPYTFKMEFITA